MTFPARTSFLAACLCAGAIGLVAGPVTIRNQSERIWHLRPSEMALNPSEPKDNAETLPFILQPGHYWQTERSRFRFEILSLTTGDQPNDLGFQVYVLGMENDPTSGAGRSRLAATGPQSSQYLSYAMDGKDTSEIIIHESKAQPAAVATGTGSEVTSTTLEPKAAAGKDTETAIQVLYPDLALQMGKAETILDEREAQPAAVATGTGSEDTSTTLEPKAATLEKDTEDAIRCLDPEVVLPVRTGTTLCGVPTRVDLVTEPETGPVPICGPVDLPSPTTPEAKAPAGSSESDRLLVVHHALSVYDQVAKRVIETAETYRKIPRLAPKEMSKAEIEKLNKLKYQYRRSFAILQGWLAIAERQLEAAKSQVPIGHMDRKEVTKRLTATKNLKDTLQDILSETTRQ